MRLPAQAIAWEICARNRWALFFAFGLIPFCGLLRRMIPLGHEFVAVIHVLSALMTFVSLIWVCSYTANDSRGAFTGFPAWMYTLPLRTSALVIYPILLGTVLMLVAAMAWEFSVCAHWNLPFQPAHLGWHALMAVAMLISAQAIIWSLHRFRWIRVVTLVAVLFGFLYIALVAHVWEFNGGAALWFTGVALSIPLAFGATVLGVERDRRGRWEGWTGKLLERLLDLIPHRSGAFKSAARAQLWFEWRRKGWFMVAVFAVPMALSMLLFPLGAALNLDPVAIRFHLSWPFLLLIFLAGAIGGPLAKPDAWSAEFGVHPVVATKPLGTSGIVFAKMKAAAVVTCFGWLLFAILLVPVIALRIYVDWDSVQARRFWPDFAVNFPKFHGWLTNPLVILALIAATWHTMVQTMTVVLTGHRRRTIISAWQGIIVLVAAGACAAWLYKDRSKFDGFLAFLPWFTAAMMALKAFRTVRAFRAARRLVSHRDFVALLGLWGFVATLVLAAGAVAHVAHGLPGALLWLLVLWQFFPAGEIPACVSSLAANRHR